MDKEHNQLQNYSQLLPEKLLDLLHSQGSTLNNNDIAPLLVKLANAPITGVFKYLQFFNVFIVVIAKEIMPQWF